MSVILYAHKNQFLYNKILKANTYYASYTYNLLEVTGLIFENVIKINSYNTVSAFKSKKLTIPTHHSFR